MESTFCQAGGMSSRMARKMSIPPWSSTSSMLSRLEESEPSLLTSGWTAAMSGIRSVSKVNARAFAQFRLPWMVLISPLCARKRNGWASRHCGRVFVEKRWWKTHSDEARRSSRRSGKNVVR